MHRQAKPVDRKLMREMNQNTLLNLIREHAPVSRAQLMELSGLSFGTVVGIISILLESQLVIETGVAESTGGRKASLLEIAPDGGYAIGISLLEEEIALTLLNLNSDIVYAESRPAHLRDNAAHAVDEITTSVESFIARCGIPRQKIIGLGCGVSGVVDVKRGQSIDSWILNWHNVELGRPLEQRLHMPVIVENAVDCLISYEKLFGKGVPYHDFMLISLGRGLGLSLVIRDEVYRGGMGKGAEFGHIPFKLEGRTCECGNKGCLEEYVADRGMLQTYQELRGDPAITYENHIAFIADLYDHARQGDAIAQRVFEQTGAYLGTGLATLINLFNPQCLIIYGGLERCRYTLMEPAVKAALRRHIFSRLGENLVIEVESDVTMVNWARGAGCIVLRKFFALPSKD